MILKDTVLNKPIEYLPIEQELKSVLMTLGFSTIGEILSSCTSEKLYNSPGFGIKTYKAFIQLLEDNNVADLLKDY